MDKLLVPIIILLVAAVISVIVILLSGKKKTTNNKVLIDPKDKDIDLMKADNSTPTTKSNILPNVPMENKKVLPDVPMNNTSSVLPNVPMSTNNNALPKVDVVPSVEITQDKPQVIKKVVVIKKEEPKGPLPVVDIPVPDVSDTPITIEEIKSIVNENTNESIEVEETKPLEETVNNDEIVNVDISKQLENENTSETIEIEESKPIQNDMGENITIEESKPISNEYGETAFKSMPNGNTSINRDIKIEQPQELYNKTEIFNLDEIKEELRKIEEENKRDTV